MPNCKSIGSYHTALQCMVLQLAFPSCRLCHATLQLVLLQDPAVRNPHTANMSCCIAISRLVMVLQLVSRMRGGMTQLSWSKLRVVEMRWYLYTPIVSGRFES